jgi:hypoxanthine phosphoribosyltransferase
VEDMVKVLAAKIQMSKKSYDIVLGITNGGVVPAALISRELGIDHLQFITVRNKILQNYEMLRLYKEKKYLVIDDIYDTGDTFRKVSHALEMFDCDFAFLVSRYSESSSIFVSKILNHSKYVIFPWERKKSPFRKSHIHC